MAVFSSRKDMGYIITGEDIFNLSIEFRNIITATLLVVEAAKIYF